MRKLIATDPLQIDVEYWDALKSLMKSGLVTIQACPLLLEKAKLAFRMDVLLEIVRSVFDLSVSHIVEILNFCLNSYNEFKSICSNLFLSKNNETFSFKSKLSSKHSLAAYLRLLVEAILFRSSSFTLAEISEHTKLLPTEFCLPLLRYFSNFIRLSINSCSGLEEIHISRSVMWIAGILDGHFGNLLLEILQNTEYRKLFESIVLTIKMANENFSIAESVLKHAAQIKRCCSSAEFRVRSSKQQQGIVYEIEELDI